MWIRSEADVAAASGLSEHDLRKLREQMTRGRDWAMKKGAVWFSQSGLDQIAALAGGPIEQAEPSEKKPAAGPIAPVVALRVERLCPNPTWVQARVDGALVAVLVPNNRGMLAGKNGTVLPRCQKMQDGRYRFLGNRRA